MRNLDSPNQHDIARSDVFVPDGISLKLIAVVVLSNDVVLRNMLIPNISLLEKIGEHDQSYLHEL
jgi:hypothetical protein